MDDPLFVRGFQTFSNLPKEQERFVNRVAHAADGGRRARGALADGRAFLDNGDPKAGAQSELPGDGQADDAGARNDHVVAFHLTFAGYSWSPGNRPGGNARHDGDTERRPGKACTLHRVHRSVRRETLPRGKLSGPLRHRRNREVT